MSSYSRQQLEDWLKTLTNIKGNVLDVGGSQNPVLKRLKNTELYVEDYKILDLAQPHEVKEKPDIILDLNMPHSFVEYEDKDYFFDDKGYHSLNKKFFEYFDIAFCLEVSEYWWDPVKALRNINGLLKSGGILYISFHFIYPVHNPYNEDYLRYTPRGAEKILNQCGFEIEEIEPRLFVTESWSESKFENFDFWGMLVDSQKMKPSRDYNKHKWSGCLIKAKKV